MPEFLASKIFIEEETTQNLRAIPQLTTGVLAIEGVTEMGPIMVPTKVTSWDGYKSVFGGYVSGYETAEQVFAYFAGGGQECWVSRVVHLTSVNSKTPATAAKGSVTLQTSGGAAAPGEITGTIAGPWTLSPNDTLVGSVGGAADQTATFLATAASVESGSAETYDLDNGQVLTVKIDGGATQTIAFLTADFVNIDAATAEEVATKINSSLYGGYAIASTGGTKVSIISDKKGTGSIVQVTGGSANAALGFSTSAVTGTGNVANIQAVVAAEVETILEAAWTSNSGVAVTATVGGYIKISTVLTGATASVQVKASSTAETIFGLDTLLHSGADSAPQDTLKLDAMWHGAYANSLKPKIADASSGILSEFNLYILSGTTAIESFPNLTMDASGSRYAPSIINALTTGSVYFVATDMGATGSPTVIRPANNSGATVSGGNDGLTSLAESDFVGAVAGETGLYAFDATEDPTLLAVPDKITISFQIAMLGYCLTHRNRKIFALLDCPAGVTATYMRDVWMAGLTTAGDAREMGGIYWPGIKIINPNGVARLGSTKTIRASGSIAGMIAVNDITQKEGPFYQPAGPARGIEGGKLPNVVGLEDDSVKKEPIRDILFPNRINPITYLTGYGYFVDGARCLVATGQFPSVGERRGVSIIEKALDVGLQWVRHRNHTNALREEVHTEIVQYLTTWMNRGAFASQDASTAFFVDVSDKLNTPAVIASGQLIARIGLATNTPAEFLWIKVVKDTRALVQSQSI